MKFVRKHYYPPARLASSSNTSAPAPAPSSSQPRLAIYQSASAMHGKRNSGFHWMSEVVRRQNAQMRALLVHELGEWHRTPLHLIVVSNSCSPAPLRSCSEV